MNNQQAGFFYCPLGHQSQMVSGSIFCTVCGARLQSTFPQMPRAAVYQRPEHTKKSAVGRRVTGAGLLALALLLLPCAFLSPVASVIIFPIFIGLFVPGLMLMMGTLGVPEEVVQLRAQAAERGLAYRPQRLNLAPREFRYRFSGAIYALLIVMATGFLMMGLLMIGVLAMDSKAPQILVLFLGGFFLLMGGVGFWYTWRISQMRVVADAWGLQAVTLLGRVQMPWNEILTLREIRFYSLAYGQRGRTVYRAYSLHQTLEFNEGLDNVNELIAFVNTAVARNWQLAN